MKHFSTFIVLFFLKIVFINAQNDVETLAQKLTQDIKNDSLKVITFYKWITENIHYDHQFRRLKEGDTTLTQEAYNVVKRKKAVCVGFSKLLKAMCITQGIESVIVYGYAKGEGYIYDYEGHAWNAVKINDNWYLLDATWGSAGSLASQKYLFADPTLFLETHIPTDPMWQLVEKPISLDCFSNRRNCFSEQKEIFHFKDSIAVWQNLDSLDKKYNEGIRILRYNENDVDAIRQLGGYYFQKAYAYFADYQAIKQAVRTKKRKLDNLDEILALLKNAESQLMGAKGQYEKLKNFAKKNRYTDAHMNLEMIEENLNQLEAEKAFVTQYFMRAK